MESTANTSVEDRREPESVAEMSVEQLVEEYRDFVMSVVNRVFNQHSPELPFEDAVAYGFEGLLEARQSYDPERGTKFGTFAYMRVRGAILDGIEETGWASGRTASMPETDDDESLLESADRRPSLGEKNSGAWSALVRRLEEKSTQTYLVGPAEIEEVEREGGDDDPYGGRRQLLERIRGSLEALSPLERSAVVLYYFDNLSMSQTAETLDRTKGWISRLLDRAVEKLRDEMDVEGADEAGGGHLSVV